jgi:hypothetical protein
MFSHAEADSYFNTKLRGGATPHILLHTGDPGADGTQNVAQKPGGGAISRKAVTFGAPENHPTESRRRVVSSGAVSYSGSEIAVGTNVTHFSIWTASTGGTVQHIAALDTAKTTGSDGATIAAGDITVELVVFAKPT